ncbi:hypothetical protein [Dehalobacter sp. TeCB1]|uniref:hypothetical protein n=1 Tax=Dehalobacter sp. TeCB1 TaxID=1843715 RepID=UPI00083A1CCF|nr:hypothetical protein [Dehalobacter sp. TeCB1]OCZ54310.1 hypothetical protein A7D23_05950 [Dehalobacter sp. TeCB1]
MTISNMNFSPTNGLRDPAYAPTDPANEAVLRGVIQGIPDQIRDFINDVLLLTLHSTVLGSSGSEEIASPTIPGIAGNTVYTQIANLLSIAQAAQAGTILPGTVTDTMLSNIAGQIKDTLILHLADKATSSHLAHVQPDGTTITADANGVITSKKPVAAKLYAYRNIGGAL